MSRSFKIRGVVYQMNFKTRQWIRLLARRFGFPEAFDPRGYEEICRRIEQRCGLILFNDDVKAILFNRQGPRKQFRQLRRRIAHTG